MKSTILKTGALAASLMAAGAGYAAPFNFITDGPNYTDAPASPPPFNFINGPVVATDQPAPPPRRHHHHMEPEGGR